MSSAPPPAILLPSFPATNRTARTLSIAAVHMSQGVPHSLTARPLRSPPPSRRDAYTMNMLEIPQGAGSGFVWDDKGHVVSHATR